MQGRNTMFYFLQSPFQQFHLLKLLTIPDQSSEKEIRFNLNKDWLNQIYNYNCLFKWASKLKLRYESCASHAWRIIQYSKRNLKTLHVDSLITLLQVMHSIFFQNICCSSPDICKTLHRQSVAAWTYQHHWGFTKPCKKTAGTYQLHLKDCISA